MVRHRAKLVHLRSSLKCEVHAVLAGAGIPVPMSDLFGVSGTELLDRASPRLPTAMRARVNSSRSLIGRLDFEIEQFARLVRARLRADPGYAAVQKLPGVGPTIGAVFIAEIGQVERFPSAAHLASWAGLTPKHRESDTTVHRGRITKQGSRLGAAVEAVQHIPAKAPWPPTSDRVAQRRGRNQAKVAAARELVECVYYALRDGTRRGALATAGRSAA